MAMTQEQGAMIDAMRSEGFVIVIWTPEEVGESDGDTLEDIATSAGNDYLQQSEEDEESENHDA